MEIKRTPQQYKTLKDKKVNKNKLPIIQVKVKVIIKEN